MRMRFVLIAVFFVFMQIPDTSLGAQPSGQDPADENCAFPTYKNGEVDRKLKILAKPEPEFSRQDRREHASEKIVLTAVFCGSGVVTKIRVKSGLSDGLNAKAIEAARKIKFIPGEKDGNKVSQSLVLEYRVQW